MAGCKRCVLKVGEGKGKKHRKEKKENMGIKIVFFLYLFMFKSVCMFFSYAQWSFFKYIRKLYPD